MKKILILVRWLYDFLSLFFPNTCVTCAGHLAPGEQLLCISCTHDLPRTHYFGQKENPVRQMFTGRVELNFAASWLQFEKGNRVQLLMHAIKYRNRPELAEFLGELMGHEWIETGWPRLPEVIIPVPIHRSKKRLRGYNQSDFIARGIGRAIGVPVDLSSLIRKTSSESQTKKKRYERWENVESVFSYRPANTAHYGHILLVDDVVTTGATIEACCRSIRSFHACDISIITLARSN